MRLQTPSLWLELCKDKWRLATVAVYTGFRQSHTTNITKALFRTGLQDFAAESTALPLLIGSLDLSYDTSICLEKGALEHGGLFLSCALTLVQ